MIKYMKQKKVRKAQHVTLPRNTTLQVIRTFVSKLNKRHEEAYEKYNELIVLEPNKLQQHVEYLAGLTKLLLYEKLTIWRRICDIENEELSRRHFRDAQLAHHYRTKAENEVRETCFKMMTEMYEKLYFSTDTVHKKIMYYKLKADFYKVFCEFKFEDLREESVDEVLKSYRMALELANGAYLKRHPLSLSIHLSLCIFLYQELNEYETAICLAQRAIEEAYASDANMDPQLDQQSAEFFRYLNENLKLWYNEQIALMKNGC
ncbi:14-3-3-like protein B [Teleopsis dalmanni]|uniref:14-3-3-like protein B n=1 Tax=Teleopsis dalmanni TaxID=139649 RepID=UPI0018CE2260|nr:14-3-3-like protein B [Teleopsis dalmanni]